jgi:hypothetical protein
MLDHFPQLNLVCRQPRSFWPVAKRCPHLHLGVLRVGVRPEILNERSSDGRTWWATAKWPDVRFSALGSFSERSLKVRRLLREQEQAGALPAALTI